MIERIALVITLSAALVAGFYILRYWHVRRMRPVHAGGAAPTLLYFRGDHCAVCPTQERAIGQLVASWHGDLRVERIDAERDPETAARYNVFSLPTTLWLDGEGRVRQVNYGLADAGKLARQAAEVVEQPQASDRGPQTMTESFSGSSRPSPVGGLHSNLVDESTI
jgi:thiol-disulfide isomerase/thioredoxin